MEKNVRSHDADRTERSTDQQELVLNWKETEKVIRVIQIV